LETLELPTSLQRLVLSRIDQLASHQQLTLKVASIIGRLFRFDHLQGYYPNLGPTEATRSDLDVLARLDLTPVESPEPDLTYLFRHIITHEVAYENLPAATRMALHELYARFLEEKSGDNVISFVDRLAYHYDHSDNLPKKLQYLTLAGDAAVSRFSNEQAIRYYQRAITLIAAQEKPETYKSLAAVVGEKLGDILHLITRYAQAREAYWNALACLAGADIVSRANLQRKIGNAWRDQHEFEGALKVYSEALQMLGLAVKPDAHIRPEPEAMTEMDDAEASAWQCWIQIHLEILSVYYWLARVRESEQVIGKISTVIEKYGAPGQRASFFQTKAAHYIRRDRFNASFEAIEAYKLALEEYQKAGFLARIPATQFQYGMVLMYSGQLERAEPLLQSALQQADQRGDLSLQVRCLTYLTILYRQRKLVEVVESFAETSLHCATTASMPEYVGAAQANQAWVAWQRGDTRTAEELGLAAMALWGQSSGLQSISTPYHWTAIWPLICVAWKANNLEKIVTYIRFLLEPVRAQMPDELQFTLEQVSMAWEAGNQTTVSRGMERALALADRYHYL
jgi:tetratricopeptide (TPR) repeat protein